SGGELARALAAGVPAGKILVARGGKTEAGNAAAPDAGILQFNGESGHQLRLNSRPAASKGRAPPGAPRGTPKLDAATHAKITTGKAENKFGIEIERARDVARVARGLPGVALEAVAVHIGSQLTQVTPFEAAFARVASLAQELAADGSRLKRLDL